MSREKSETVGFRLRKDQLNYVDSLAEERDGSSRSGIIRDIVTFHRAVMTTGLAEDQFIRLLEDKGFVVIHPEQPVEEEVESARGLLESEGYEVRPPREETD